MNLDGPAAGEQWSPARESCAAPPGGWLAALAAATARLDAQPDDSRVLPRLVDEVADLLAATDVRLALLEGDSDWLAVREAAGRGAAHRGARQQSSAGLLGQALQRGTAFSVADLRGHPLGAAEAGIVLDRVIVAPLRLRGRLLGAVLAARPPLMAPYSADEERVLQVLADLAAARVDVARATTSLGARAQDLALLSPVWRPAPEQAGDFVLVADHTRRIVDADAAACRILGYPREALLQHTIPELFPMPPWAENVDTLEAVREQLLRGIPITHDTTIRRRDGSLMPVRMTLQMLTTPEGRVSRGILSDLSMESRAQLQTLQAEKMRLLEEIGSALAHELNTPLSIVMGNTEMVLEEFPDMRELRLLLEPALEATQRIAAAVHSLQRFAQPIAPGSWTAVDLNELAEAVVQQTRPLWEVAPREQGRSIYVDLQTAAVPPIPGHPIELQGAIRELIANAVQALPQGGTITVRTEANEDEVRLSVADNGVGMTEVVRQRCIEPFFTTRRPLAMGLGLNRVYHAVLRHRGTLEIESTLGAGSRITLAFRPTPTAGEAER